MRYDKGCFLFGGNGVERIEKGCMLKPIRRGALKPKTYQRTNTSFFKNPFSVLHCDKSTY